MKDLKESMQFMQDQTKDSILRIVNTESVKVLDVDYSGFTDDPQSKPTTMTVTFDITEHQKSVIK